MAALPDAEPSGETSLAHLPLMLTVPEAANVLRIGRSVAYKLAHEWDATRGQRGLPVVRFGSPDPGASC